MKENFRLYRILIVIFLCFIILLVFTNLNLLKSINSRKTFSVNSNSISRFPEKKYGYMDILKIVDEDANLNITSMEGVAENESTIKLNLRFTGGLDKLYNCLEKLKSESCFVSIEEIKINKKEDNNDISFEAVFLKTK